MITITNGNYDDAARHSFKLNPATVFSWWLVSSYCYYCRYESILSDEVFDKMSKYILCNYDSLNHQHKHLVSKEGLTAGSGYYLKEFDFPLVVRVTGENFIANLNTARAGKGSQ